MKSERRRHVDIAKGIAIISIILGHLGNSTINRFVFTYHVPIFFLIAGYYAKTDMPIKEYVKTNARRILVPYYVTCLCIILLAALKNLLAHSLNEAVRSVVLWTYATLYAAGDSYQSPFYITGIGAIWFLWGLFWALLLLRLVLRIDGWKRDVVIAMIFVLAKSSSKILWLPLSIQAGCTALFFVYAGYLVRKLHPALSQIPSACKTAFTVVCFVVWGAFIKNFKTFWLVHSDVGRGIIDLVSSLCACYCVLLIAILIDKKTNVIASAPSFFGKNSLLVLCVHITELNLFPWGKLMNMLESNGMPTGFRLPAIIAGKMLVVLSISSLLSKCRVRWQTKEHS